MSQVKETEQDELTMLLQWFRGLIGLGAFGLCLGAALLAGVDPLWAMLRATASAAGLIVVYAVLCRVVVPLLGAKAEAVPAETGDSAGETAP